VNADERFELAIAREAHRKLYTEGGLIMFQAHELDAIAAAIAVPDTIARHVVQKLTDQLLLRTDGGWTYIADVGFAARYEQQHERGEFWTHNQLRREELRRAADAFERDERSCSYHEGETQFVEAPWAEAIAAAKTLEHLGLVDVREYMGHNFEISISPAGYDLIRDEAAVRTTLPVSASDDEGAHIFVPRDILTQLITSTEEVLRERQWNGALRELGRGDTQYDSKHWTDAVREYYAAVESGLKHRLDEEGIKYGDGWALKDLAGAAARHQLIPVNYQALFGFADSIRSPRSHGSGGVVEEIEVGPAEALLMGNHARTLLLYLAHRPRVRSPGPAATDAPVGS
jgi:hypothetical protein